VRGLDVRQAERRREYHRQAFKGRCMSWKWNTDPLSWKDKCSVCRQPLRVQGDGGIVIWTDSKHYHVWCLLDRLACGWPLPQRATRDSVSHWGVTP
jgi:hypothetical protein